jgi:hypothetical protein
MKHSPLYWLVFISLIVFLLAACTTSSMILPVSDTQIIDHGSSFGQSFTAQNNGLSGLSVLLAPIQAQNAGNLLFHLKTSPQSNDDLALARLPLSEVTHQAYYKIDFPPQRDSRNKDYYLQVDVEGEGQVRIFTAAGDSYLDGALYVNQAPQDNQLGFQLEYDRTIYVLGSIQIIVGWILVLIIGFILFIIPGWGLFSLLWRGWDVIPWFSKLGLSSGLSFAIYPLLLLWTHIVGMHLGAVYAFLPPTIGIIALIWKNRNFLIDIRTNIRQKTRLSIGRKLLTSGSILVDIAFVIILGLIIVSRFWVIRSLEVPLFGDSYQHTMISQLIIDHGGLFDSWEPYTDLVTFTYHFGFHSAVAVYHWFSGVSVENAMLWTGQLTNILAILGLYPLVVKIAKNRWAGVLAMLIAGLLSPMPMYYINWGRYTQLAGLVILPTAIYCAWSILERSYPDLWNIPFIHKITSWRYHSLDFGSLMVVWLVLGGVALTHYRILILAILFFPAFGLFTFSRKYFLTLLARIGWIGIGGTVLFLPWFIHVFGGKIMSMFAAQITTLPSELSTYTAQINSTGNLNIYLPLFIWLLFFFCVGWGLWKRNKDLAIFIIWWFLIVIATNPNWIGLPGIGIITNFAILIAFYIPASVTIGSTLSWILIKIQQPEITGNPSYKTNNLNILGNTAVMVIICFLGIWGLRNRLNDLNLSSYALITRPDLRAMTWIRDNLPTDAEFLVNSFFAYNNSTVVGSDGGWWIPLLAGRKTSLPPITYGFEEGVGSATAESANSIAKEIQVKGIINPEIISMLLQKGIRYIYLGQRQGSINYIGPQILNPELMNDDPNFKVVYHQDRVWIFQVIQ